MKKHAIRDPLPLGPLLHAYLAQQAARPADIRQVPGLGPRFAAASDAAARFLNPGFLDSATPARLLDALAKFHDDAVTIPLHGKTLATRTGFLRHSLSFLMHGE